MKLPLFKSHYSIGRSILTLNKAGKSDANGSDSIIDIAKENSLKQIHLVEDGMTGFLEAYKNCKEENIDLRFGLRMTACSDIKQKDEDSRKTEHRIVIFCLNSSGYFKLIKLQSIAATDGFYYYPRIDFKTIHQHWNDKELLMAIPFYDSFLFNNSLTFNTCIPDFGTIKPFMFLEENNLPFDHLISSQVTNYASSNSLTVVPSKSIYYKKKEDFKAYIAFRCIHNRTTLDKPELEHMSSDRFSFEALCEDNLINVATA